MGQKPILFIDVDGVLFGGYEGRIQLRPNVWRFLEWCTEFFECYWLTAWPEDRLRQLAFVTYGLDVFKKIKYCDWMHMGSKAQAAIQTANDKPFFWLEDGIMPEDAKILAENNKSKSYIYVNEHGRDALDEIKLRLMTRIMKTN